MDKMDCAVDAALESLQNACAVLSNSYHCYTRLELYNELYQYAVGYPDKLVPYALQLFHRMYWQVLPAIKYRLCKLKNNIKLKDFSECVRNLGENTYGYIPRNIAHCACRVIYCKELFKEQEEHFANNSNCQNVVDVYECISNVLTSLQNASDILQRDALSCLFTDPLRQGKGYSEKTAATTIKEITVSPWLDAVLVEKNADQVFVGRETAV
jgi:hypothetical protein